jgi:hypothetical protein
MTKSRQVEIAHALMSDARAISSRLAAEPPEQDIAANKGRLHLQSRLA